jgi:hypothetical protein
MMNKWCDQLSLDLYPKDYKNIIYRSTKKPILFNSILCQRMTELLLVCCMNRISIDTDRNFFWYYTDGILKKHNIIVLISIIRSKLQSCFTRFSSYIRIHGIYNRKFITLCYSLSNIITNEIYLINVKERVIMTLIGTF